MVKILVDNKSRFDLPSYESALAAGLDLKANLSDKIVISPMERKLIPTGLFIALPIGYEVQIRPRSGLALKHGITVLNSPGTIDSDYRGEIGVILINLSHEKFIIMLSNSRFCKKNIWKPHRSGGKSIQFFKWNKKYINLDRFLHT